MTMLMRLLVVLAVAAALSLGMAQPASADQLCVGARTTTAGHVGTCLPLI